MQNNLKNDIVPALAHVGYSIVYFLFLIPFELWVKAVGRLAEQKKKGTLKIATINSPWPLLSFIKTLILEFLFDFLTFLCYPIGIIVAIYMGIDGKSIMAFILALVGAYYLPIAFAVGRDFFQLLILPFRKFISWCRKPAQYLDLNKIQNCECEKKPE